jgi:hypothetical protein
MLRTLFPALPDTHFKAWSFNRVVIVKHLLSWINACLMKLNYTCFFK